MNAAQREHFCQEYIRNGGDQSAAYDVAFPPRKPGRKNEGVRVSACRLMKEPDIRARIDELRVAATEKYAAEFAKGEDAFTATVADIAKQLDEDRELARSLGQPAAAVSASVAKGKLFGHFVEKKDITIGLRPDEARQVVAALLGKFSDKIG